LVVGGITRGSVVAPAAHPFSRGGLQPPYLCPTLSLLGF
jgi:hypothetical protein